MTAHEVFVSLFWLITMSYLAYLTWFVITAIVAKRDRTGERGRRVR